MPGTACWRDAWESLEWILYAVNRQGKVCRNASGAPEVPRAELPKAVWFSAAVKYLHPRGMQHRALELCSFQSVKQPDDCPAVQYITS